ncbi:spore coat protein U-like protein [Sphingomonas insulae]|nr:hypothetical protein [Sphingomonas insulae]NIJ30835.1 spore coat protein U-like protein [Sphingomonas insulae]
MSMARGVSAMRGGAIRVLAAAALAAAVSATPAQAEAVHQDKLVLNVHGRVPEHCALGGIGDMNFGDLTKTGIERAAQIGFSCNVPFQLSIRSARGGLANEAFPQGQGPYAGLVPYSVAVSIPVRRPGSDMLTQSFTSTALLGGATMSSGGGIALDGMQLTVVLAPPSSEAGLLGGRYSETVTITVAPI